MLGLMYLGEGGLLMVTKRIRQEEGIFYWHRSWDSIGIVTNDFETLGKRIGGTVSMPPLPSGPPLKRLWMDRYSIMSGGVDDISLPPTEVAKKLLSEIGVEIERVKNTKHYIL